VHTSVSGFPLLNAGNGRKELLQPGDGELLSFLPSISIELHQPVLQ
jgi:hypothetical protein